jgi:hypothetical protein
MLNECIGDNAFIEPFAIIGLNPFMGSSRAHTKTGFEHSGNACRTLIDVRA